LYSDYSKLRLTRLTDRPTAIELVVETIKSANPDERAFYERIGADFLPRKCLVRDLHDEWAREAYVL